MLLWAAAVLAVLEMAVALVAMAVEQLHLLPAAVRVLAPVLQWAALVVVAVLPRSREALPIL